MRKILIAFLLPRVVSFLRNRYGKPHATRGRLSKSANDLRTAVTAGAGCALGGSPRSGPYRRGVEPMTDDPREAGPRPPYPGDQQQPRPASRPG